MPIADFKFTRIKSFITQDGRYPFKLTLQRLLTLGSLIHPMTAITLASHGASP